MRKQQDSGRKMEGQRVDVIEMMRSQRLRANSQWLLAISMNEAPRTNDQEPRTFLLIEYRA